MTGTGHTDIKSLKYWDNMITEHFTYYQPEYYSDDSTSIEYGGLPEGLFSFQAFRTRKDCEDWLMENGYNAADFVIHEYQDDEIEDVTLLNDYGENIDRIEDLTTDEIADRIVESVIWDAGSVENLRTLKQDDESDQEYQDRIYTEALGKIMDSIEEMESENDYNFQSYAGSPEVEWYDEARDIALIEIMGYMTGEEE